MVAISGGIIEIDFDAVSSPNTLPIRVILLGGVWRVVFTGMSGLE
jgi:hypothetical protein